MKHIIGQLDSIKNKMSKKGSKWMDDSFMDNHTALIQSFNNLGSNLKVSESIPSQKIGSQSSIQKSDLQLKLVLSFPCAVVAIFSIFCQINCVHS